MEDAKKNLFEDGDMVDCNDTEDSIFMQICNEIDAEDQSWIVILERIFFISWISAGTLLYPGVDAIKYK